MRSLGVHILLGLVLLCNAKTTEAQQLKLVSNSHYNLFNENVAFAGNYDATHFTTDVSKIWTVNGAPTQYMFSFHTPLKNNKLGFGLKLNQIYIGAHEESMAKLAISYKIPLRSGLLSFGLGAGASMYNFDVNKLTPLASEDFLIGQNELKNFFLDADFGVMYTSDKTYAGIELNQITQSSWKIHSEDSSLQKIHFKVAAGHVFSLKNQDFLRLSAHARSDINLTPQVDVMLSYFYKNFLWLGAGYRLNYGLLANVEINVTRRLQFGYMYSSTLGTTSNVLGNRHEVFLGFMLPTSPNKAPKIRNF